jgi:hypothetical protein
MAFYWDPHPVNHDRPLLTNCYVPGLAIAAGLHPSSATEERDLDIADQVADLLRKNPAWRWDEAVEAIAGDKEK